jgi:serine/threonine-protein kinase
MFTPPTVPGYRVLGVLGRGGASVVYRARDLRSGRPVALKLLAAGVGEDALARARFRREARCAAALLHPAIVPVYAAGEASGQPYIAMRLVEGGDLRALLARRGRLSLKRTLRLLAPVAGALDAAHACGLVHRDVKPANILVEQPGELAWLADFGLVHDVAANHGGGFVGSVGYAAPEQIDGQRVDCRADVYALGCVLVHCLAGRPPFVGACQIAVLHAHMTARPPSLRALALELPHALDDVLASALAKSPAERFATCCGLLAAAWDTCREEAAA